MIPETRFQPSEIPSDSIAEAGIPPYDGIPPDFTNAALIVETAGPIRTILLPDIPDVLTDAAMIAETGGPATTELPDILLGDSSSFIAETRFPVTSAIPPQVVEVAEPTQPDILGEPRSFPPDLAIGEQ